MERRLELSLDGGQLNGTEADTDMSRSSETADVNGGNRGENTLDSKPIFEPSPESTSAEGLKAPEQEIEKAEVASSNKNEETCTSVEQPLQSPMMENTEIASEPKTPMRSQSSTSVGDSNVIASIEQNTLQ
jgi:hypothetical protein